MQSQDENPPTLDSSILATSEHDDLEAFRQMQLEMLRRENQELSSQLDALTDALRAHDSMDHFEYAPTEINPCLPSNLFRCREVSETFS